MRRLYLLTLLVALNACAESKEDLPADAADQATVETEEASRVLARVSTPVPAPGQAPVSVVDTAAGAMLIRTGTATLEVNSLESSVAQVRTLMQRLGGYVTSVSMQTAHEQRRAASMELRIPSPRFDEVINGLPALGDVDAVHVTSQDVGEEYVDLQTRVANRRRLEQRLLELLANRTGSLEDVLAVERELARVREEIERQEGRLQYLRSRVAFSTLSLQLYEGGSILSGSPSENVLLRAGQRAWESFVWLVTSAIASLGIVIPLGLAAWIGWRFVRGRRRPLTAGVTPTTPTS